jgi:hypothetical protein
MSIFAQSLIELMHKSLIQLINVIIVRFDIFISNSNLIVYKFLVMIVILSSNKNKNKIMSTGIFIYCYKHA